MPKVPEVEYLNVGLVPPYPSDTPESGSASALQKDLGQIIHSPTFIDLDHSAPHSAPLKILFTLSTTLHLLSAPNMTLGLDIASKRARKRSDYFYHLDYRLRWYIPN